MNITINGKPADITLEGEKTVGEVLAGLNGWLDGSGFRLSGLEIDGTPADSLSLGAFFDRELADIQNLDIKTSSLLDLAAEALLRVFGDSGDYEKAGPAEKKDFVSRWRQSPAALFLAGAEPEIYRWAEQSFSGGSPDPAELRRMLDERLRELGDPRGELDRTGPLVEEIIRRLEDLPLDIQTGKDGRAAETIRIFSGAAEKIFRLFHLLKAGGLDTKALKVDDIPAAEFLEEFSTALRELLAAYETRDSVLVGDLAEYELAPRFRGLYAALKSPAAPRI
jgi:hypothetical protein